MFRKNIPIDWQIRAATLAYSQEWKWCICGDIQDDACEHDTGWARWETPRNTPSSTHGMHDLPGRPSEWCLTATKVLLEWVYRLLYCLDLPGWCWLRIRIVSWRIEGQPYWFNTSTSHGMTHPDLAEDPDWLYVRTASMVRKIYIRKGMGVGR